MNKKENGDTNLDCVKYGKFGLYKKINERAFSKLKKVFNIKFRATPRPRNRPKSELEIELLGTIKDCSIESYAHKNTVKIIIENIKNLGFPEYKNKDIDDVEIVKFIGFGGDTFGLNRAERKKIKSFLKKKLNEEVTKQNEIYANKKLE